MIKISHTLLILFTLVMSSCNDMETAPDDTQISSKDSSGSYTLWFVPEGALLDELTELIDNISDEYDSPKFTPHVTLLGSITGSTKEEVLTKVSELAEKIEPLTITLTELTYPSSYSNDYEAFYRSLYILGERTRPLMRANELARELFGRVNDPPFNPHLSIMYGPFSPETKDKIIQQYGREFNVHFKVDSIYVCSDKGQPKDWKFIKKISFGKTD